LTISKLRNRLDSDTAQALLCLKSWIAEKVGENNNIGSNE
ncbi:19129_t:CDS:1, partial [Funneliformis geosporum]